MIPIWVQRLPTIWVAFVPGLDPRMPPGAVVLSVADAHKMVETVHGIGFRLRVDDEG